MIRALRGESVERPPVWFMRQAGRYMKVYQDLCKKHKTFRERSENVDLAVCHYRNTILTSVNVDLPFT